MDGDIGGVPPWFRPETLRSPPADSTKLINGILFSLDISIALAHFSPT